MRISPSMIALHEQWILKRAGGSVAGIPGALALLCVIAFATGIIDPNVREDLAAALWGSLGGAVVFGALYFYVQRRLRRRLAVFRGDDGVRVEIEGRSSREVFGGGFTYEHGVFVEHIEAYVAARDAPVVWVQIRSSEGRTLTVRQALGIQHEVPAWPRKQFLEREDRVFSGDPVGLFDALEGAGLQQG